MQGTSEESGVPWRFGSKGEKEHTVQHCQFVNFFALLEFLPFIVLGRFIFLVASFREAVREVS